MSRPEYFPLEIPPGINADDSEFTAKGQWTESNGFRFKLGRPETIGQGTQQTATSAVVRANKLLVFDQGGTISVAVAGDTLRIGPINAASTDVTPAGNWTSTRRHCLAMFGNVLLALVSGGKLFESSAGAQAVAVTNAPTQSTVMLVTASRQVMLLGTQEEASGTFNGRCIRWSDIENREDWSASSSDNAGEYILPGQEGIVGACLLGDYILIWTEGSLWLARFTGDPSATFSFERIDKVGLVSIDAWAIYRQTVYWIGTDMGFYSYQLGGIVQHIPCPLARWLTVTYRNYGPDQLGKAFGCSNSRHGEIWFGLPNNDGAENDAPAVYVVFCVDESDAAQRPVWFSGLFASLTGGDNVGAMVESSLVSAFGDADTELLIHAYNETSGAKQWQFDGNGGGITGGYIQSGGFYLDESARRMMIRSFVPDFPTQDDPVTLTVSVRDYPHSDPVTSSYTIDTTDDKKDFRKSGKIAQVKFALTAPTRLRIGRPLFDVVPMGMR